jgi:anti-sigma B factor antagonist
VRRGVHAEFSLRNGSPEATVVAARGEIDAFTARNFAEKLSVAAENASGSLLIDLEAVDFLDAKGYAAILNADRKMRERGGEALVVCSRSTIRRIFTLLDPRGRLRLCP